jgi:hypothetical protein
MNFAGSLFPELHVLRNFLQRNLIFEHGQVFTLALLQSSVTSVLGTVDENVELWTETAGNV